MAASVHSVHSGHSAARIGAWEALSAIAYGFVVHPHTPHKSSQRQSRPSPAGENPNGLHTLREEPEELEEDALRYSDQATLEIGDEVYAFERLVLETKNSYTWYRGYVLSAVHTPNIPLQSSDTSLSISGVPSLPSSSGPADEPEVFMGIFPASNVHIREHLADAEGRLAEVYSRMISGQSEGGGRTLYNGMSTVHEEGEATPSTDGRSEISASTRPRSPRGPRPAPSLSLAASGQPQDGQFLSQSSSPHPTLPSHLPKPPPPRPSVKSSDETTSGVVQPLVDEIASALREWHPLMFKHLQRRDYRLFSVVKEHIEALHLGRRQLLTSSLSVEEAAKLRRDCVIRLVQGNVAQGLDIIVRHPIWGGLVTIDSENEADPRTWMSAVRMYAMQASLAYVNHDVTAATVVPKTSALTPDISTAKDRLSSQMLLDPAEYPNSLNPNLKQQDDTSRPTVTFFHVCIELRAFVASLCSPGETAELYFSLYNRSSGQFVTEDYCAVLNHNGVSARDPEGSSGPVRALFRDLSERDIQDELYLVCRIVRNGAMKFSSASSSSGSVSSIGFTASTMNGVSTSRRGSEPFSTYRVSDVNELGEKMAATANGNSSPIALNVHRGSLPDWPPAKFRRPFGAGLVELTMLKVMANGSASSNLVEYSLPIFVPVNESTYSTLHQHLIAGNSKDFEKSSRAQTVAVVVKAFRGEVHTVVKENASLLQQTVLISRLGFPDVVFPEDSRNEIYVKLWSGEFYHVTGSGGRILSMASFPGNPTGPSNVQVSMEVRTRAGALVDSVISQGNGEPHLSRFHSMVFHRNNSPTYGELIKVVIPAEIMQQCHLFFTFRHRSSKERGDLLVSDKPFAYAYLPLFPDGNAFHPDGSHTLVLYRADKAPWSSAEEYFNAPATITPGQKPDILTIPSYLARTAIPMRDSLTIRSLLCSTQFTQNAILLGLLSWEKLPDRRTDLESVLSQFKHVSEVEIVKFLRDIFDSLFAILVSSVNDTGDLDDLVFNALVIVLGIVQDRRFKNFQPVLDVYIAKHFASAAASTHMLRSIHRLLLNPSETASAVQLRNAFKVWHYIMRFVVRARELQKAKEVGMGTTSEHLESTFKKELLTHLTEVNRLMSMTTPSSLIGTQTIALQQFTTILPDLGQVFTPMELVTVVSSFSNALSGVKGRMTMWKLIMYLQIARGFLFEDPEARALLIESLIGWIKPYMGRYDEFKHTQIGDSDSAKDSARIGWLETLRMSNTIIAVMLDRLQVVLTDPNVIGNRKAHRLEEANVEFLLSLMPRTLESYVEFQIPENLKAIERTRSAATTPSSFPVSFPSNYPFTLVSNGTTTSKTVVNGVTHQIPDLFNCGLGEAAVVFIVMILASTPKDLNNFFDLTLDIEGPTNLTRMLTSMLTVASSILNNDAYPSQWLNINVLTHAVLLKLAEPIGAVMITHYVPDQAQDEDFDQALWFDYLHMLLRLLSSEQLVIEEFSPQKRRAVWRLAGDIRGAGAVLLLKCWDAIGLEECLDAEGQFLARFGNHQNGLNDLVDQVLTLCLSHHDQLRTNAVQILFSMLLSEYQQTKDFIKIKTELINKLDELFMSGSKADDVSRAFFINQLRGLLEAADIEDYLRTRILEFLGSVDMFLELLISVRELPDGDEFLDDKVIATLRLMNFIREIGRDEIYIKYVHHLANVHIRSNHFVEAALTLKLHADLHEWNLTTFVDPLPDLDLPRQSSFVRKETLVLLILDYLGKGQAWENAIEICQELSAQHMETTYNYQRLSEILNHQAALLQRIVTDQRQYPSYFRVAFYGDFPTALKKQPFIYRGYEWEKYLDFCERLLQKHTSANLLQSSDEPSDAIMFGSQPYIHCTMVTPEPDRSSPFFTNPNVAPAIKAYYEHNDLNLFSFSMPFVKPGSSSREVWTKKTYFRTEQLFPTVLRRSEVIDIETVDISPIENALLHVQEQIKELTQLEVKFDILSKLDTIPSTNALTMALNEIVDSPPDTGLELYRQTYLTSEYTQRNPTQEPFVFKLRAFIDELTKVVDHCLRLHSMLCPEEMIPFHETLEGFFRKNFHEEIARIPLDAPMLPVEQVRSPMSPRTTQDSSSTFTGGASAQGNGKRTSRAMNLGRGGPSLYPSSPLTATPGSPSTLHFAGQQQQHHRSRSGDVTNDVGQTLSLKTPLQRNLAQLARHGIPGMSSALSFNHSGVNGHGHVQLTDSFNLATTSPSNALVDRNGPQSSPGTSDAALVGTPVSHVGAGGSMLSRKPSIADTIGGRLSRFGSILRKGDQNNRST